MSDTERTLLVHASVFITLSEIGHVELLRTLEGEVVVPGAVADEIVDDPASARLDEASGWLSVSAGVSGSEASEAAAYLGSDAPSEEGRMGGDVALLASALAADDPVVVSDDKPLRGACKSLGIDVSGSVGVLVAAVEGDHLGSDEAKRTLEAMDQVGARLSASLLKRAERLIDDAADD